MSTMNIITTINIMIITISANSDFQPNRASI